MTDDKLQHDTEGSEPVSDTLQHEGVGGDIRSAMKELDDGEPAPEEEAPAEPEGEPEPEPEAAAAEEEEEEPPIEPLENWDEAAREMFRELPRPGQEFVVDQFKAMQAAHTKRSQEIAPFRSAVEQWNPYLQQWGVTADQAFNYLMGADQRLRTGTDEQKRAMIEQIARDYGVSQEQAPAYTTDPMAEDDRPYVDPEIARMLEETQRQMQAVQSQFVSQEQAMQQRQMAEASQMVETFRTATNEDGSPKHPYFGEVEAVMATLAQAEQAQGRIPNLDALYEQATWSTPEVRAKLMAAANNGQSGEASVDAVKRTAKKKKAASSVAGESGSEATPDQANRSLRDEILAASAGTSGRV